MFSTIGDIVGNIITFFTTVSNKLTSNVLFIIALAVEVLIVLFFLLKSAFSYETKLNRSLDKLNYWIFQKKVVTEENIKDLNMLFKTSTPKRVCYYRQQYILFRDGAPSTYLSTENLIEKPLKTSSYNSNIKNLSLFTTVWALISAMFMIIINNTGTAAFLGQAASAALLVPICVFLIGLVFMVYLRARKNAILNSLYQNVALLGRFMDNACIDLPSYIDYQILFTPQEIEKGQPVLREFLDFKARKEKEEFQKAKEDEVQHEVYDFSSTGIDGSIVLDRAMKESELFLKKKEKLLVQISQLESELDSRRKNFDNTQKEYQTKIQASKENIVRLRQMQEETTNRIESNYYRKQQTQEVGKQEQLEQEFEQLRAKYMLEKNEGEEEIQKLNQELEQNRVDVENAMKGEYQTFFDKFCKSAEKVVAKAFKDKVDTLNAENEKNLQRITDLEIKLKNVPQGEYNGDENEEVPEGKYDENGNYVYPNGTYYDADGNYHDEKGNVYTQSGELISEAKPEKVDLNEYDPFEFMTDLSQKDDIYNVAENVIKDVDEKNELNLVEREQDNAEAEEEPVQKSVQEEVESVPEIEEEPKHIETKQQKPAESKSASGKKRGRPRKVVTEQPKVKRSVGRPKKIVKEDAAPKEKRGRGRPRKQIESIVEINKKLSEEEAKINELRTNLNQELANAVSEIDNVDDKQLRREELLKQIDVLQKEAQEVIDKNEPEDKISEINKKLENLLDEISKLDS